MGGGGFNLFNTDVSKKFKPGFMVLDPGGGLAKTVATVLPSQTEKAGLMQSSVNAKNDREGLAAENAAAMQSARDAQSVASSQAAAALAQKNRKLRGSSQSVFTSPLGLSGTANLAKKYLLGQ